MLRTVAREILLSFWKVHILHHASEKPIYGQEMARELQKHGYIISPGTLYPMLSRMERHGWLKCINGVRRQIHARKEYRISGDGRKVLAMLRSRVEELHHEVVTGHMGAEAVRKLSRRTKGGLR
jgi:PadR family transcriptional regulator, regulatory protein PadR